MLKFALFLPGLGAAVCLMAQEPEMPVFRTETNLALVRFHVVQKSRYLADLRADEIELLEDGKPRPLVLFEGGFKKNRQLPVEMVMVFDTSGSVTEIGLLDELMLKEHLLDQLPSLVVSMYRFSGRLQRVLDPTRDFAKIQAAINSLRKRKAEGPSFSLDQHASAKDRKRGIGGSPIYEAAMEAARDASSRGGNLTRMMLLFSDGFATSGTSPETAAKYISSFNISAYPVALGHHVLVEKIKQQQQNRYDSRGQVKPPSDYQVRLEGQEREVAEFASLGEMTGGRSFDPLHLNGEILVRMLDFMVGQVRNEYVAGYNPPPPGAKPRAHKVEVRLKSKLTGKVLGGTRLVTW